MLCRTVLQMSRHLTGSGMTGARINFRSFLKRLTFRPKVLAHLQGHVGRDGCGHGPIIVLHTILAGLEYIRPDHI